jgi:SAM-dependent methyltransferase
MTPGAAGSGVPPELKQAVVAHYEAKLRRHGPTPEGMDWKDAASQRLRFRVLCEVCDLGGLSLHEVGAGAGHLLDYLRERGVAVDYSGSDLSPAMVEAARRLHPGARFELRDLLLEAPAPSYDVVVCSGLFHVSLGQGEQAWRRFVHETLRRMWALCRVAIAFNLMSDQVDYRVRELYYSSPGEMLDFCRRELGRFTVLRHDYPLHEYTVYVYRRARAG